MGSRATKNLTHLAVAIVANADGSLPTEARLFKAGWNDTEKGPYLFDDEAARLVLDHQDAHNVDRMIDLEHLSLDDSNPNYDPDARGWGRLEVRNGELWIVNLSWTPDGTDRLTNKKQRYLSPAFPSDDEGRITKIVNIALTALPATHDAPALVAASSRKGRSMDHSKQFIALAGKFANLKKLADDSGAPDEGSTKGKAAAVAEAAQAAQDAIEAYLKTAKNSDMDATLAALDAAKKAVDDFEAAANALVGGAPVDPGPAPAPAPAPDEATLSALKAAQDEVVRLRANAERRELQLAEDRRVAEAGERRQLVGQLVVLGVLTPGQAWSDAAATMPKGTWAKLSLGELKDMIAERGGVPSVPAAVKPAVGGAVQTNSINISEYQINRLRATHDREKRNAPKAQHRDFDTVLRNFARIGEQQVKGAEAKGDSLAVQRLSRGLNHTDVLTTAGGDLVSLASTPVQPIQQFGASSQRALEEFRLEFNSTLVSLPIAWAEELGQVLPGGGLKETFPLAFYAIKYREKVAQNSAATNPNSVDVTVQKKLFSAAAEAELIRITRGDFAYIQTWNQSAANMARARINLRNHLIADLLEAATTGYWGLTVNQPNGIDGQPFFSAAHKVNPFDTKMKLHGSSTWSNYQSSATPLTAPNLTAQKAAMYLIPGPDGEELGSAPTGMLNPTSLKETGRVLLTVQDLILGAQASLNNVNNVMGQVRNEHFNSGFEQIWAPQLAGADTTANYYLFSRETIGRGLPPWVLAEDAAEEVRIWDETSDFYKNGSGWIKTESLVYCNAALLYPHGIRLVKGS